MRNDPNYDVVFCGACLAAMVLLLAPIVLMRVRADGASEGAILRETQIAAGKRLLFRISDDRRYIVDVVLDLAQAENESFAVSCIRADGTRCPCGSFRTHMGHMSKRARECALLDGDAFYLELAGSARVDGTVQATGMETWFETLMVIGMGSVGVVAVCFAAYKYTLPPTMT